MASQHCQHELITNFLGKEIDDASVQQSYRFLVLT